MLYGKQHRRRKVRPEYTFLDDSSYRMASNFPLEQVPKFDFIACIRPTLTQFAEKYLFSPFFRVVYADFPIRSIPYIERIPVFITSIARNICLHYCSVYSCLLYDETRSCAKEIYIAITYRFSLIAEKVTLYAVFQIIMNIVSDLRANLY